MQPGQGQVAAGALVGTGDEVSHRFSTQVNKPSAAEVAKIYHKPWAVILCKFNDLPNYEPHPAHFYKEAFTEAGAGKGREFDYFWQISQGRLDMTGTKVFGWLDMPNHGTQGSDHAAVSL